MLLRYCTFKSEITILPYFLSLSLFVRHLSFLVSYFLAFLIQSLAFLHESATRSTTRNAEWRPFHFTARWKLISLIGETPFQIIAWKADGIGHLARSGVILRETFPSTASLWHKQATLPFRIFCNRSLRLFCARDLKRTCGTITYAQPCQWLLGLATQPRIQCRTCSDH